MKRSWTRWFWPVWLLVVAVTFSIPEGVALFDGDPATQPLTNWIADAGLATVAAGFGLWLFGHFRNR